MAQKITVQSNQNLIEIACRSAGSLEAVLDLMTQTGYSITTLLEPGQEVSFDLTARKYETPVSAFKGVYVAGSLTIGVIGNQHLMDVAIQEAGTVEAVIDLMKLNNLPITQVLNAGQQLTFQMEDKYLTDIQNYYKRKNLRPATGNTQSEQFEILEGVDYWAIEVDFKVS